MTRWFYERARGQYLDALGRAGSPTNQRTFKQRHPLNQKFAKTDVAKFENTWAQRPHVVAQGADKNFAAYMLGVEQSKGDLPDRAFFECLVAKAIMFRASEKLVGALQLGGYRAQTVTYTLALMSRRLGDEVDLDDIWRRQQIPDEIAKIIETLAPDVHAQIVASAGRLNISEHAKRPACWQAVLDLNLPWLDRGDGAGHVSATEYVPIHADIEGQRIQAVFDRASRRVMFVGGALEGETFKSPSGAAAAVVRHHRPDLDPTRNGWAFWTVSNTGEALQSIR